MKPKIAIDIGSSYTKIYKSKMDVVLCEPTCIAIKNKNYRNPDALCDYVYEQIIDDKPYYILLDEVQYVDEFEDVLNSFLHIKNADTYVFDGYNSSTTIFTNHTLRRDAAYANYRFSDNTLG